MTENESVIKNISRDMMFEFDKEKLVGSVRCQFVESGVEAGQFTHQIGKDGKDFNDIVKEKMGVSASRLGEIYSDIMFKFVKDYDNLVELCGGEEGFGMVANFFLQADGANFWVRLQPIGTEEYNCYIKIYHQ